MIVESRTEHNATQEKYGFILFINGMADKSVQAIANLQHICDSHLSGNFELQIIDISTDHELAVEHQIIGIPTLIKLHPGSRRTILGDLSDTEKVLKILQIK
jgi:circadian clock protein KaiB